MNELKPTKGDVAYTAAKAVITSIPVVGGAASEIFSEIVMPPLTKRRDKWIEGMSEKLTELESRIDNFSIESLLENPVFITCLMYASQSAMRNHQEEKLDALRNAVLNSAVNLSIDENIQLMFIQFIDSLTPCHLKILQLFDDPNQWFIENNRQVPNLMMGGPLSNVLESAFDDLRGRRNFYDQLVKDLYSKGLMSIESLHVKMSGNGALESRTTDLGKTFIEFIKSPIK